MVSTRYDKIRQVVGLGVDLADRCPATLPGDLAHQQSLAQALAVRLLMPHLDHLADGVVEGAGQPVTEQVARLQGATETPLVQDADTVAVGDRKSVV